MAISLTPIVSQPNPSVKYIIALLAMIPRALRDRLSAVRFPAALPDGGAGGAGFVLPAAPRPQLRLIRIPPAGTCQWIEGEPSEDDACKCGRPSIPGRSYCAPHLARARTD